MRVINQPQLSVILSFFFAWISATSAICIAQDDESKKSEATPDKFSSAEAPAVRRIVFFNSGIAQIVHQGAVEDNQSVELSFDRDQIDDVLKSLVFDSESGIIESVQYQPAPGKESLAADQLGPPMTLAQTLQNYRGESIELTIGEGKHTGSILGVETREVGDKSEEFVTLVTKEGLKSHKLADADTVRFESEKVQEEFRLAMIGMTKSRDVERKALSMYFAGKGKRKIQFGYVVDAPVWRMTYRLDVDEKTSTLQGWAHVDNVTGFDWENVYIDLRSGRPQAFNVGLFAPLVAQRERRDRSVFGIPSDLNLVARYFGLGGQSQGQGGFGSQGGGWFGQGQGGQGGGFGGGQGGGFGGGLGGGGGGGLFGQSTEEQDEDARRPLEIGDGVDVAAAQGRAARMLQFAIEKPVNLASGRSAMLPILKQPVAIELMTRFDLTRTTPKAELVAKMTNGKKFSMVAGPVTIYQDGGFTGDAELPRVDIGQKKILVYGIDQPLSLSVAVSPLEKIYKRVRFDDPNLRSRIVVERIDRVTRSFRFSNKDTSARKILVQLNSGRAKTEPKPQSRIAGAAQYEFDLPADTRKTEAITFDTATSDRLSLSQVKPETLKLWKQSDATIEEDVEKQLVQYFELSENVKLLSEKKSELDQRIRVHLEEIERLTGIIQAVKTEATAAPFIKQITEREQSLANARAESEKVYRELNEAKQKLSDLLDRDSSKQSRSNQSKNFNDDPFGNSQMQRKGK